MTTSAPTTDCARPCHRGCVLTYGKSLDNPRGFRVLVFGILRATALEELEGATTHCSFGFCITSMVGPLTCPYLQIYCTL